MGCLQGAGFFIEDQSRVRKDHAPQNMAIVR